MTSISLWTPVRVGRNWPEDSRASSSNPVQDAEPPMGKNIEAKASCYDSRKFFCLCPPSSRCLAAQIVRAALLRANPTTLQIHIAVANPTPTSHLRTQIPQPLELSQNHRVKIRPIPSPQLTALQSQLSQRQRLLYRPIPNRSIKHFPKSPILNRRLDIMRESHRWPSRENLQQHNSERHARLLIFRIDVTESSGSCSHVALSDGVGDRWWDEAAEADIADLADEVSVEKDVPGLEVAVDEGLGSGGMEEVEGGGDLGGDSKTGGPREGRRPVFAVETVLEGSVFHVLVDEASVLGAGAEEDDHVWVAHSAKDFDLRRKKFARCEFSEFAFGGVELSFYIRPQDLDGNWGVIQCGLEHRSIPTFSNLIRRQKIICCDLNLVHRILLQSPQLVIYFLMKVIKGFMSLRGCRASRRIRNPIMVHNLERDIRRETHPFRNIARLGHRVTGAPSLPNLKAHIRGIVFLAPSGDCLDWFPMSKDDTSEFGLFQLSGLFTTLPFDTAYTVQESGAHLATELGTSAFLNAL
ncbi:deoxyguanosinetriphosphatetriphosphohydrolase-like protein [Striga asiatica]|uniref:Deoxyguanosinetriphosphatetriphosphohydrolase-like protein n=1 Tax=Striga asiatica TaxID=4170 RepID=A0A5A7P6H6_STRAF|nr:deoxyguanosinetriphosphatetriphosphohydrolase-like protein [Striga asiatica]